MKKLFVAVVIIAAAVLAVYIHHLKAPETMLEELALKAKASGDVKEYLTGEARRTVEEIENGSEKIASAGFISKEQIMIVFVRELREVDFEFVSLEHNETEGIATFKFSYTKIINIDGKVTFVLVKEPSDEPFWKTLFENEWKISDIGEIDI